MLAVPAGSTTIPQLPDPFVPRARLLTSLDAGGDRPVLVCAPAGFGKTALLAHWARAAPVAPVAWANLSSAAGDHLWPTVLAALLACSEVPGHSTLHELARHASAPTADVLDALDALRTRVALVLHDVHEVVSPTAQATLGRSSPHVPPECVSSCAAAGTHRSRSGACDQRDTSARSERNGCASRPARAESCCACRSCTSTESRPARCMCASTDGPSGCGWPA